MGKDTYKLKKIGIKGYKSIAFDTPLELELGDINILLGSNGAGKSNIIGFFKMLGYMMSGSLQLFVEQAGTNQKFLYYGSKRTSTLCGELRFENSLFYDIYKFSLTHAIPDRLIIRSEEIEWGSEKKKIKPQVIPLEADFKESALINATDARSKTIRDFLSKCKVYQFHDSSLTGPLRQPSTVDSAHYLQSEGNNLASFLYYLKQNDEDSYRRIVSYVQMIMPQFRDFYLEPSKGYVSLKWIDASPDDYVLSPDQFSDGSIRFIALATLLLQPEQTIPNVIIIDEPELGLHPYAIDQLIEMIKDASLHAQIIVATQSPALIDSFNVNDITIIERDEDKQCTCAHKLDGQELKDWLENYTISELWDKNVIGGRPL
jgi:predicted ATPase